MAKPGKDLTLRLIIAIALIDAILIAVVRLRYMESHSLEPRPVHGVAGKPTAE